MPYFAGAAGWFTEAFYAHQVRPRARFSPHVLFSQFSQACLCTSAIFAAARICCSNLPASTSQGSTSSLGLSSLCVPGILKLCLEQLLSSHTLQAESRAALDAHMAAGRSRRQDRRQASALTATKTDASNAEFDSAAAANAFGEAAAASAAAAEGASQQAEDSVCRLPACTADMDECMSPIKAAPLEAQLEAPLGADGQQLDGAFVPAACYQSAPPPPLAGLAPALEACW